MTMRRAAVMALLIAAAGAVHAGAGQQQFDLGRHYRHGDGVQRDSVRAFALIETAARAGHPAAMFTLHNMLAAGEGTAQNEAAARHWLEQAADREYPEALQQLALHLQDGAFGYARDERRAAQLLGVLAHAMKHRGHAH